MSCGSWSIDTNAENSKSKSPEKQQEATTYGEEVYDVSTVSQIRANRPHRANLQSSTPHRTAPFIEQLDHKLDHQQSETSLASVDGGH